MRLRLFILTALLLALPSFGDAGKINSFGGSGGSGTPGGADTQVQFNDGGSFGGDSGFTYNKTTDSATLTGDLALNGGDLTSTSATFNLAAAATTTTVNGGSGSTGCTATNGTFACSGTVSGSALATTVVTSLGTCAAIGDTGQMVVYRKGAGGTEATSFCACEELAGAFGWTNLSPTGDCT